MIKSLLLLCQYNLLIVVVTVDPNPSLGHDTKVSHKNCPNKTSF